MSDDKSDSDMVINITMLLAAGLIVAIGYGVYRVIKAFSSFDTGDQITSEDLEEMDISDDFIEEDDSDCSEEDEFCSECGTLNPKRCRGSRGAFGQDCHRCLHCENRERFEQCSECDYWEWRGYSD